MSMEYLLSRAKIDAMFTVLEQEINAVLDRIHDEALVKLRSMARSTGQRTRVDRMVKK